MEKINPALGVNIKDYNPKDILDGKKWRVTEKIDGVRRLFFKGPNNKVTAYSRTGKQDIWLDHITTWLEQTYFPSNHIYDCELVDSDSYFNNDDSFVIRTETNSKASQEYPDNKGDLIALCFDIFQPDGDMRNGEERSKLLSDLFYGNLITEPVILIPIFGFINGYQEKVLAQLMNSIMAKNGEGLMLMDMEAPYIPGRSKNLIKIKRTEEFIGEVIDYELGREDSKIAGGISALICNVEGCSVPVRVGSGFTLQQRLEYNTDQIIGCKIEIDAFGRSKDKEGNISLSMPIFKQVIL